MKHIIKNLLKLFVKGIIIIYSPNFSKWITNRFNKFYSYWIKSEFNKVGFQPKIQYPIYLHGGKYITIGDNFRCDQRLRLDALDGRSEQSFSPQIIIGNNVSIEKDCHIAAINRIEIGNNVLIASKVYIGDHSHGEMSEESFIKPPALRKLHSKGAVIIDDNVWLGEGVILLPGVHIEKNCIIGAGAVVTKDCVANSLYAGNPAKLIKTVILK